MEGRRGLRKEIIAIQRRTLGRAIGRGHACTRALRSTLVPDSCALARHEAGWDERLGRVD